MTNGAANHHCLLKIGNITVLKKFLHQCVDEISTQENINFTNSMDDIEWSPEEHKIARGYIQNLFKKFVFEEDFTPQLDDLSSSHIEEIQTCFNIRRKDIQRAVIRDQLLKCNIPLVESIDWKIKWLIGSSKLSSLSEPLLHVDLSCLSNSNSDINGANVIGFEMNLSQMDKLIKDLEHVKTQF